jgi:hypothetical protein
MGSAIAQVVIGNSGFRRSLLARWRNELLIQKSATLEGLVASYSKAVEDPADERLAKAIGNA